MPSRQHASHAPAGNKWNARKHGGSKRRLWRKIHIGIDADTLEIRAIEVTGNHVGDAPMLPELLDQIPKDQRIGAVTADGAYDTRACYNAVANRAAHAVIPTRRNAKPWKPPVMVCKQTIVGQWTTSGAEARNEILRATKYLGRAIWRKWSGYHRRSRVETTLSGHCCAIPCRAANALCQTTGRRNYGTGVRSPGRRASNSCRRAQPLLRAWHPPNPSRRISPSGERRSTPSGQVVLQSQPGGGIELSARGFSILAHIASGVSMTSVD